MARTTGPLFSLDASGSVGGAITFSKWKGRNYVRRRVIPANPESGAQVGRRSMFRFLSQEWDALIGGTKASYQDVADSIVASTFNAYIKKNMERWHQFLSPTQPWPVVGTSDGSDNVLTAAAWEENRIKLSISGAAMNDTWGIIIFGQLGGAVTPAVGNCIAVRADETIAAHVEYWTPHIGLINAAWTFDTMTFGDDGKLTAAGGPQST